MSLLDTQVAWLANQASNYLVSGTEPRRWGNAHPNLAPYQSFSAQDGDFIVAVGTDRQFQALCQALDLQEVANDERFTTNANRLKNRTYLIDELKGVFAKLPISECLERLEKVGVPSGPILSIPQALANEHIIERRMLFDLPHSRGVKVPQIANPIKYSRSRLDYGRAPPALGEHTYEVLVNELGWTEEKVRELMASGTV